MEIVNIRIDERLIHGQVAAVWSKITKANRIMVIDNAAVKSDVQKTALKMACPEGCKLSVLSVGKAAENLKIGKYQGERLFIVVKGPRTLKDLYNEGYEFSTVNVGNMANKTSSKAVKSTVYVTEEDIKDFKYLSEKGVYFTAQMVPTDEKKDFMSLL